MAYPWKTTKPVLFWELHSVLPLDHVWGTSAFECWMRPFRPLDMSHRTFLKPAPFQLFQILHVFTYLACLPGEWSVCMQQSAFHTKVTFAFSIPIVLASGPAYHRSYRPWKVAQNGMWLFGWFPIFAVHQRLWVSTSHFYLLVISSYFRSLLALTAIVGTEASFLICEHLKQKIHKYSYGYKTKRCGILKTRFGRAVFLQLPHMVLGSASHFPICKKGNVIKSPCSVH